MLGRGVHSWNHRYYPSYHTYGHYRRPYYRTRGTYGYFGVGYVRPVLPVYYPSSTVYVERVYEPPPEEIIRYVPIEEAPEAAPPSVAVEASDPTQFRHQGDAMFRQGRFEDARRWYVRAVLAEGGSAQAEWRYGLVHFALGQYGLATTAVRRALSADPGLLDQPPNPRELYGQPAEFDAQMAGLREHTRQYALDSEALFLLAFLEYADGNGSAALQPLERILSIKDDDTLAYLLRAAVLSALEKRGQATF